ncbi:MAG: methylmalonyl-CoA mutase N-terminal domain/subunit, partial [Candidatus Aldehydirespiratoraceae bacterium]
MNSNERTNRDVWEEAFGASRIREADYSTMSGVPLEAVYGPDD